MAESEVHIKCLDGKTRVVVKANKKEVTARVKGARGPSKTFKTKALKPYKGKHFVEVGA